MLTNPFMAAALGTGGGATDAASMEQLALLAQMSGLSPAMFGLPTAAASTNATATTTTTTTTSTSSPSAAATSAANQANQAALAQLQTLMGLSGGAGAQALDANALLAATAGLTPEMMTQLAQMCKCFSFESTF